MRHVARAGAGALVVVVALVAWAAAASAHVTVHPGSVAAGSTDVELTFRVPNERSHARTVKVQVFFPPSTPLLGVDVLPLPAWRDSTATARLSPPAQTDDGPVAEAVSEVTWTATAGGITPGHYEDFDVEVGAMPGKAGDLVFKTLQTYSSGEVVRWIQLSVPGQPAPDTPAPVLIVAPAASTAGTTGTATATTPAGGGGGSGTTTVIAVVAVVVAIGSLISSILAIRRVRGVSPRSSRPSRRPPP